MFGGALNPYIFNQDISKWHFLGARCYLSRRRLPCGISLERAVRIDVSSANCRAKSNFQVRTAERNPIFRCPPLRCPPLVGHTPSAAGTFRKKFRKNSGKTPETLSELLLEFPSRVRLGSPKPYNSRHLKLPEHFQNSLPPVRLGTLLFSEVVPERASQSRSWNSQQHWG